MKRALLALMLILVPAFVEAAVPSVPNYLDINLAWFFKPSAYAGAGGAAPPLLDANGYVETNCMAGCTGGGGGGGGGAITAVAGAYAAGALVDGASINLGSLADAAWAGSGNGSVTAILKGIYGQFGSLGTAANQIAANNSLASILALQPALNGDGGANAHVMNFPASQAVTGAFYQATQPVSLASLPNVTIGAALPAGTNSIGSISLTQGGAVLSGSNGLPTTDTADATLIANTTGLALATNQSTANGSLSTIATNSASQALAANQTAVQANAGSSAAKAQAVQGIAGGLPVGTTVSASTTAQAVVAFQQTATTTAAALPSGVLTNGIVLTASASNAATIYVGPASVTAANGYPLKPGASISAGVANSSQIYMIGGNTTDILSGFGN